MAKKIGKKKEETMVMVGDGVEDEDRDEDLEDEVEDEDHDEGEDEEESGSRKPKAKSQDEDGEADEEDERVGHGEDDEEDDEDGSSKKRERESRKARRERQRKARQRNETELNFLRSQNERLEKEVREIKTRQSQSEVSSIDQRINAVQSQIKVADQVFAKAVASGTEEDITEATNIRDRLKENLTRLNGAKQEMSRRTEEGEPEVDSRLVYHASRWMRENNWYDPNGRDKDSRVVAAIDNRLVAEGYDPRTDEYWNELTDRVQSRLPHKFKNDRRNGNDDEDDSDEDDDRGSRGSRNDRRGSGPRFSTGGRERPLKKNEVYVSPERKKAMVEAGVWDDPVLRNRYLKTYKNWDKDNGRNGRSAR